MRELNPSKSPESSAFLGIDIPITWHSQITKTRCKCRLRIYLVNNDQAVVIVSELPDNPGRSITDEAFALIPSICDKFRLTSGQTMWVEHYPAGYLKEEETYDEVGLVMGYIASTRIEKQKLEALLGVKL